MMLRKTSCHKSHGSAGILVGYNLCVGDGATLSSAANSNLSGFLHGWPVMRLGPPTLATEIRRRLVASSDPQLDPSVLSAGC
jgi:hypothetical protein